MEISKKIIEAAKLEDPLRRQMYVAAIISTELEKDQREKFEEENSD